MASVLASWCVSQNYRCITVIAHVTVLELQKGDIIVRMNDYSGDYEELMKYMGTQPKHLSTQIVVEREVTPSKPPFAVC